MLCLHTGAGEALHGAESPRGKAVGGCLGLPMPGGKSNKVLPQEHALVVNVDDEMGMEACTLALMAKYGITSIPALVLLDKRGGVICADARDKCVAYPEGRAFPWRQQSWFPQAIEMEVAQAMSRAAKQGPVVQFDLPPRARPRQEPLCAKPKDLHKAGQLGCR